MKGPAHYHSLPAQDNLVLKRAQSVNKLVSEVRTGDRRRGNPSVKNYVQCRGNYTRSPVPREQMGSKEKQLSREPRIKQIKQIKFLQGFRSFFSNSHRAVDIPKF